MRDKPDFYARKAKQEGFQARSVYKLQEIHAKYRVLHRGDSVLDLGAAPGSWTQFALQQIGPEGSVVAVDLSPIDIRGNPPNLVSLQGDIFDRSTIDFLRERGPYRVLLSDAAPSTTGNRTVDTARSAALVEQVIFLASELLVPGGNFAAKIFQGGEEQEMTKQLRSIFSQVKTFKPKAVRSASFEIYLIGLDRKVKD